MKRTDRASVLDDEESSEQDEERTTNYHNEPWTPERREHMKTVRRRGKGLPDSLPEALEVLTLRSLKKLDKVIKLPIDEENGSLLRSIVTSCGIAISSQLRADEARLKQKAAGDAMQRLLKIIAKERALLEERREGAQKASEPVSAHDADGADLVEELAAGAVERIKVSGDGK